MNSCEEFSPETSLFIGNKWENIPESDKADVQEDIFKKLSKVYPGVKQRQVHFMSVSQVSSVLCLFWLYLTRELIWQICYVNPPEGSQMIEFDCEIMLIRFHDTTSTESMEGILFDWGKQPKSDVQRYYWLLLLIR